ncbi:serine/threonine-protein kinase [Streptomyces sp. NPDC018833]|uniref:serine/threonine-protein kinase n=1 Tax=Streptomyces sp. NPDC018833 TaxID=3365053 RepID=UPI0037A9E1BC
MKPLGTGDPLRLGPYRLLGVLGEGGMGKVYFGQDSFGRKAAVKVLRPELAHNTNLTQRFVREAQMAQSVTSTGVARVLGADTEGGRPWIATEFLTGPTLDDAVRSHGPLDEPTLRVLASSLARTLADIHAAGLIHRDLKPANIVLTSAGPRVIDFGIARPEHGLTLTTTGQIPVTPGFGAPEQVLGQRVGPAADVFSLGAVLIYAATGNQAFTGTHVAAVQYEVVHGTPRTDRVPPHLAPLIGPCLAKDPSHRPTPGQLAAAFTPARGAERVWRHGPLASDIKELERTIHHLTTVVTSSASERMSRRRLLTTLAVGGAVLAAGAGATAWWLGSGGDSGPYALPPAADTPMADPVDATAKGPKPLWGPVRLLGEQGGGLVPVRDVVLAIGNAETGVTAHSVVDGKRRWHAPSPVAAAGIITLSDALVAGVDKKGDVVTFVASSGEARWSVPASAKYILAADDSAVYIVTQNDRLRGISRSDGTILWTVRPRVLLDAETRPRSVAGGGRLVIATGKGRILVVDTADGHEVWNIDDQGPIGSGLRPVLHEDMVLINGGTLTARSLSDGTERWAKTITDHGMLRPSGPPLVQDDIVYSTQGQHIWGFDAADGTEIWRSPGGYFADSPVVVQGDAVCAISSRTSDGDDWALHAMSRSNTKHVWSRPLPNDGGTNWVYGDGNRLFVRSGKEAVVLPVFE